MRDELKTAAFALYPGNVDLDHVVSELNRVGLSNDGICVLLPQNHPASDAVRMLRSGDFASTAEGQMERVLAWLRKFGAVVIPGLGFFVAGRDFVRALLRAESIAKSDDGILLGLGIPEPTANRCGDSVRTGAVLVYVDCDGAAGALQAREVLQRAGAHEVSCLGAPDAAGSGSVLVTNH